MPIGAHALVTLDEAKDRLPIETSDEARDELIARLVNEVSRAVLRTTGRDIRPHTAPDAEPDTRTVALAPGARTIHLDPHEIRIVESISVNGVDVPAGAWQLQPIAAPHGVYDRIRLTGRSWSAYGFDAVVEITGWWGWLDVPEDVKGWVLDLIADRWNSHYARFADAYGQPNDDRPVTIPYRIRDEMQRLVRVRMGSA